MHDIDQAKSRLVIVKGFIKAIKQRKTTLKAIIDSTSRPNAVKLIEKKLKVTAAVAQAILELRVYQFAPERLAEFKKERDWLKNLIKSETA
jgi:DNA gyrase/topoisomerase IV subunit A